MSGRIGSTRSVVGFALVGVLALALNAIAQPQPGSQAPGSPPLGPPGTLPGPSTAPDPAPTVPTIPTAPQPQPGQSEPTVTPPAPQPGGGPMPGSPPQPGGGPGFPGSGGPPGRFSGPGTFTGQFGGLSPTPRFHLKIDPKTPTKDLLPAAPKVERPAGPVTADDLAKVPEVEFQARPAKGAPTDKLTEQTAHQLAKVNHMNAKKTDAFMAALLESRPDLRGMPFTMGDDCRTSGERAKQFTIAANTVRQALGGGQIQVVGFSFSGPGSGPGQPTPVPPQPAPPAANPQNFWQQFTALCDQQDAARPKSDKALAEHVTLARIAALMQMLTPESAELRLGLVKYLTGVAHVESTKALARLAIFSPEDEVRLAAIDSLKVRREKDYTDIILRGLRYPWPAVSKRSADAIARLGRTDLVPELVAVLEEGDPRLPATKDAGGKKVAVVRELVKVNHHRNCVMCHAPGSPENVSGNIITAEVAIPGQPLPQPFEGYRQSSPDIMIRLDVTYLRQDFSAMLPVAEAHPWPDAQRFDFFVRERELEADEVEAYREKLTPKGAGVISPYHRAALAALRDITGKDTAPAAEAWRKLLDLPAKPPEGGKVRD